VPGDHDDPDPADLGLLDLVACLLGEAPDELHRLAEDALGAVVAGDERGRDVRIGQLVDLLGGAPRVGRGVRDAAVAVDPDLDVQDLLVPSELPVPDVGLEHAARRRWRPTSAGGQEEEQGSQQRVSWAHEPSILDR